jgi:hypothetical protein
VCTCQCVCVCVCVCVKPTVREMWVCARSCVRVFVYEGEREIEQSLCVSAYVLFVCACLIDDDACMYVYECVCIRLCLCVHMCMFVCA